MDRRQKKEKKIWDKLARRYDKQVKIYEEAYKSSINKSLQYINSDSHVLDLACGTGILSLALAKYASKITGIDISGKMIEVAQKKAKNQNVGNVEFLVADAYQIDYPENSFDVILLFNTLHVVQEPESVLRKAHSLLKPEGKLVMATDCYSETLFGVIKIWLTIQKLLTKIGIIPILSFFKKTDIDKILETCNYKILERDDLHVNPVNYYISAVK